MMIDEPYIYPKKEQKNFSPHISLIFTFIHFFVIGQVFFTLMLSGRHYSSV